MSLLSLFEKLGDEHWSAKIKEERLVFFREQIAATDKKISVLETENSELKTLIKQFESKLSDVEKEKSICQANLDKIHSISISEKHKKILLAVASYSGQYSAVLAQVVGLSEQETMSKLNYLSSRRLLHFKTGYLKDQEKPKLFPKAVSMWFVSDLGHAYINSHNLNDKIL